MDDMYHEGKTIIPSYPSRVMSNRTDRVSATGEGHFDDGSNKPSGAATPMEVPEPAAPGKRKAISKKAKTPKQILAIADGSGA